MLFRAFDLFYCEDFDYGASKLMGSIQMTIL